MILVTGATGQLGRAVVAGLLDRMPADEIAISIRDPAKAADLSERGVSVRRGDFDARDGLTDAFRGATQVLVISVDNLGETAQRMHRAAIDAARSVGAHRVLYTSHMGARSESPFTPAHDHAAAEADLAASRGQFTALRHGFYAESALHLIANGLRAGEIRAPEDGPVSWTARADLAEADAAILADEGRLDGITPPLTASEALTMADIAILASELMGREIKRMVVPDDTWREEKVAQGVPAPMAEALLGMYRAARRGDFAATGPTLGTLLNRRPKPMRDVLATYLAGATS